LLHAVAALLGALIDFVQGLVSPFRGKVLFMVEVKTALPSPSLSSALEWLRALGKLESLVGTPLPLVCAPLSVSPPQPFLARGLSCLVP